MATSKDVDPAQLREAIRVLKRAGRVTIAETLEAEWGLRSGPLKRPQHGAKARNSLPRRSCEASSAALPAPTALLVTSQTRLVATCLGVEEDVWRMCPDPDTEGHYVAPFFEHGAGLSRDDYEAYLTQPVSFISVRPYEKQPPPNDLPWSHLELRVFYQEGKTDTPQQGAVKVVEGDQIGGRYRVEAPIDAATFSRTIKGFDTMAGRAVCLKIIHNGPGYLDQALDEVRILRKVNQADSEDTSCVVRLFDYFYFCGHLVLVTELLLDNLYECAKRLDALQRRRSYFTLARLQRIGKQVLTALKHIHSLGLIHCDIKPENIAFESTAHCDVKVLDLGSSCYLEDSLSSYVQSRPYRAPEVILGCRYGPVVDIWSLGATIAELASGNVLFNVESVPTMLASICSVCGPIPAEMLQEGRNTAYYVTKHGAFYGNEGDRLVFHFPTVPPTRKNLFGYEDPDYVGFVRQCLTLDPALRPAAAQLLEHPFLTKNYDAVEAAQE